MCTLHADSARTVFPKLLAYVSLAELALPAEAVYSLMSTAVHLVVHIQIVHGVRQVVSIHEVVDADGISIVTNEIYSQYSQHTQYIGLRSETASQLEVHGFSRPREMAW
jgi:Flp pilus assembly CpaF family ATPase